MARVQTRNGSAIRIAVDIGGTFTDGVAERHPEGRIWVAKRLTTPDDPGIAVGQVVRDLLEQAARALARGQPGRSVVEVVHGTTLATNTIIERKGARTGLIVTPGTRDALDIGREVRYDLYDLDIEMPKPLVPRRLRHEVPERLDAEGKVRAPLDEAALADVLAKLARQRVEAVAVCLLHSFVDDAHEKRIGEAARKRLAGVSVSLSSEVAGEIREYERMSTTAANAYVQPLMARYLGALEGRLRAAGIAAPLRVMISSGGFTSAAAAAAVPILLLESGPAGGVLSAINTAALAGIRDSLTFDMGGTTAKACVAVDGKPSVTYGFETARVRRFKRGSGLPILTPSIDLIEIGAGGGSIARASALGLLNVGPESAGAEPGPACYGRGGREATVTDADLVLGYLDADRFLGGEMKLRKDLALQALARLGERLGLTPTQAAAGISDIVNENMAAAARVHIAEKGLDPRRFTLVATGGAGPVHAVEVAAKLRIARVACTIAAGAGSCLGLLAAPARVDRAWSKIEMLDYVDWRAVSRRAAALRREAGRELGAAGARAGAVEWLVGADVRYAGQGHTVVVALPYARLGPGLAAALAGAFEKRYVELYGRLVPGAQPQVVTWRLSGRSRARTRRFAFANARPAAGRGRKPVGERPIFIPAAQAFRAAPVYERYALPPGTRLRGPLVLQERESTVVVARPARVRILGDLTVSIDL